MATIRKRLNGRWQVLIRRKGFPKQSKVFRSKADANQWARYVETEFDKGQILNFTNSYRITLRELIDKYQSEIHSYKKSFYRESNRLKIITKHLGHLFICQLNSIQVSQFRDFRLSMGLKPATVVKDLNTLSKILQIAKNEWGLNLPKNPVIDIRKPKVVGYRVRRINTSEEKILLNKSPFFMRLIIIFAIETGMRLGEIIHLNWCDIRTDKVILQNTKNNEVRYVPLSNKAIDVLKSIPKSLLDSRVFYHYKTVSGFESSWQKFKKREGLVDLRFHDLRHEAISRLFEKGLNHMEVSSISGHKSLLILRKYTHYNFSYIHHKLNQNT